MSVQSAALFLRRVEEDLEFRSKILSVSQESSQTPASKAESDAKKRAIALEYGFDFTKEDLFAAAGVPPIELSEEAESQLRHLDKQLRERGFEGINPLAFTAYSLGIN